MLKNKTKFQVLNMCNNNELEVVQDSEYAYLSSDTINYSSEDVKNKLIPLPMQQSLKSYREHGDKATRIKILTLHNDVWSVCRSGLQYRRYLIIAGPVYV